MEDIATQLFELRYKADPKFLDSKGEITRKLVEACGFQHWQIDENRINFAIQKPGRDTAFVSFHNCGTVSHSPTTKNYFEDKAAKFLTSLFKIDEFKPTNFLRLGVKSTFAFPYNQDFKLLVDKYKKVFLSQNVENFKIFPGKIIDIGFASIHFESENGNFNIVMGPMPKDQFKDFFNEKKLPEGTNFPETGIFFDIDYFKKEPTFGGVEKINTAIKEFSKQSWDMFEDLKKLLLGSQN